MIKVRCVGCRHVFEVETVAVKRLVCPGCGRRLRGLQLPSSTAGDSMFIDVAKVEPPQVGGVGEEAEPDAAEVEVDEKPVVFCPNCASKLYINRRRYGGRRVPCPRCGKKFHVPRAS